METFVFRGGGTLVWLLVVSSLFVASFCDDDDGKTVEVVGVGECADCAENKLEISQAFLGLRVTIDCKPENENHFKTQGSGELDEEGKFKVTLPLHLVKDGKLKQECYAQLHNSASARPCPSFDNLESTKIIFLKSTSNEKHQLGLNGNLKFSPITCASASFLPHHHHKYPPLPKLPPFPPSKSFFHGHNYPHPVPVYKKPVYKPHPVPVYKKPVYKPHPVPIYKPKPLPPIPHKPLPQLPKIPPFTKKPCPPLPKLPPKYVHHPKFGKWPPLPPFAPYHP